MALLGSVQRKDLPPAAATISLRSDAAKAAAASLGELTSGSISAWVNPPSTEDGVKGRIREAAGGGPPHPPSMMLERATRLSRRTSVVRRSEERRVGKECRSRWS